MKRVLRFVFQRKLKQNVVKTERETEGERWAGRGAKWRERREAEISRQLSTFALWMRGGGGGEDDGQSALWQNSQGLQGSVYACVCVCGNGQKCARLCVYVHEEGAGQEASINSRFSPTSRVHGACLRIQWGRHVSSSCRAELIIYRWLTLQCSSLMNLQVSETGYSKAKLYSYRYNLHKCAPQGSLLGFKVIMGSFKDTICSQEAKGTCTCLLDIKVQYQ